MINAVGEHALENSAPVENPGVSDARRRYYSKKRRCKSLMIRINFSETVGNDQLLFGYGWPATSRV